MDLRMYEPYGFESNENYVSKKLAIERELAFNRYADHKEFTSVEYNTALQAFVFRNIFGKAVGHVNLKNIVVSELLDSGTTYDKEKKCIVLVFKSGQTVEIPVYDLMDIAEAGDGLIEDGTRYNVLIDETSELCAVDAQPYLSVSKDGLRIDGINMIVEEEMKRAVREETALNKRVDDEIERAEEAENILTELIESEKSRAIEAENNERERAEKAEEYLTNVIGTGFSTANTKTVTYRYEELGEYLQKEVATREQLYGVMDSKIDALNARYSALQASIDSLHSAVSNLQTQVSYITSLSLNQRINDVNSQLSTQLSNLALQISTLNNRINYLEDVIS